MANSEGADTDQSIVLTSRNISYRLRTQGCAKELLINIQLFGLIQHLLRDIQSIYVCVAEILQDFAHDARPSACIEDSEVCVFVDSCFS